MGFRWSKFSSHDWIKFCRGKKFLKEVVYRAAINVVVKRDRAWDWDLGVCM